MSKDAVVFKGSKEGILIKMNEKCTFDVIKVELKKKLKASKHFFYGADTVISVDGKKLNYNQFKEIEEIINQAVGISNINIVKQDTKLNGGSEKNKEKNSIDYVNNIFFQEGKVRIITGTIRNGQSVYFDGNIVVIGDVNPGGELIASGNIMVMGMFRGIAHAGVDGSRNCFVAAYCLQPTQLRISNVIARCPDNNSLLKPDSPEIAYINQNNALVIEPYQSWKAYQYLSKV